VGIFQRLLNQLLQLLAPIIKPVTGLVSIFTAFKDNTVGIIDAATSLVQTIERTFNEIKNFKTKPQFKNRVISVPRAVDNLETLAQVPGKIIQSVRDLVEQLRNKLQPAAFNIDDLEGLEDLRGAVSKLGGRIAAGFEKILGIVTLVVDALVTIRSTIRDLQTIADSVEAVISDLSALDGLFLPQNNPRKTVVTTSGDSLKLRLGNLHS
jgi:hypothetical protein